MWHNERTTNNYDTNSARLIVSSKWNFVETKMRVLPITTFSLSFNLSFGLMSVVMTGSVCISISLCFYLCLTQSLIHCHPSSYQQQERVFRCPGRTWEYKRLFQVRPSRDFLGLYNLQRWAHKYLIHAYPTCPASGQSWTPPFLTQYGER